MVVDGASWAEMKTLLTAASFGLALVAAAFLLVWPVYSGSDGVRTTHATLLQVNGSWVIVPVGFPVIIAWRRAGHLLRNSAMFFREDGAVFGMPTRRPMGRYEGSESLNSRCAKGGCIIGKRG